MHLGWLPVAADWAAQLDAARRLPEPDALEALMQLANRRLDFIQTARLDRAVQQFANFARETLTTIRPVRLALLGSSTLTHLIPGIRIGALRRGIWVDVHEGAYGSYRQELLEPGSVLHAFKPDVLLFSFDARHLAGLDGAEGAVRMVRECWRAAKDAFGCTILQQAVLPIFRPIVGNNEHRYAPSRARLVLELNQALRTAADDDGAHIVAVDAAAAMDGLSEWHEEALWHRSKQEIHPRVSHVYGDLIGRLMMATRGRSSKCLVLDLDNTLWGGVIGDDGLGGISIGQGSALGEAHLAFQQYALDLSHRGVILAVCSKNDEAVALEAFDRHPDMLLRRDDISCFVANWNDKASNLRQIAQRLNIGIDSLVFADDNPFERNLIRRELPQVAVPELPEDPAGFGACISAAGYFETLSITREDQDRIEQYRANEQRERLREAVTDMDAYLGSLDMKLHCTRFDELGLPRVVQLINKTNQFNLTTRRYSEAEVREVMSDPRSLGLQFRLVDRFGDNGVIGIVIGRVNGEREMSLDTWLMSCRVLGRQVEVATLNVLAKNAAAMGATRLIGLFRPTEKNAMVKEHYPKLGFEPCGDQDGFSTWRLALEGYRAVQTHLNILEGPQ
jgi:FkbH-like protein